MTNEEYKKALRTARIVKVGKEYEVQSDGELLFKRSTRKSAAIELQKRLAKYPYGNKSKRRKNLVEAILPAVISGAGFTVGSKLASHYSKRGKKRVKKKNPGAFLGVRLNGSKLQIKVPNRNPSTIRMANEVAMKLGARTRNPRELYYLKILTQGIYDSTQEFTTLGDLKKAVSVMRKQLGAKVSLRRTSKHYYDANISTR